MGGGRDRGLTHSAVPGTALGPPAAATGILGGMRTAVSRLALALALGAATLARAGAPEPTPPPPPTSGFGAPRTAGLVEHGSVPNPIDPAQPVHWWRPAKPVEGATPLVVAFLHGFGARTPDPYLTWIEHLARGGATVVYPVYPALEVRSGRTRYDTMWAGFQAGLAAAAGRDARPAHLGVVGHSFGGGAAPAIAARAAARGLGSRGLFVACFAPWYDLDRSAWDALPATTSLLVATYEDDAVCDPAIGAGFLALAKTVPAERKALRVWRSDDHGRPTLKADHLAPITLFGYDALDTRGSWRCVDALCTWTTTAAADAREVALGTSASALDLGAWSDGTPVRAALATWAGTNGRRPQWRVGGLPEESMRKILRPEAWSTLRLPDVGDPTKLAASERFVAEPPTPGADGWPAPVATALARGAVVVVPAEAPAFPDADRLAAAGVTLVRLAPDADDALATALAPKSGPTALVLGADGRPRLWKPADDPRLVATALALVAPPRDPTPAPVPGR